MAHVVVHRVHTSVGAILHHRLTTTNAGTTTWTAEQTVMTAASGGTASRPSIAFQHTGDEKTVSGGSPHLFVLSTYPSLAMAKATYSAGSWTWGTSRTIDSTRRWNTSDHWLAGFFDGTRFVMAGQLDVTSGGAEDIVLYERDAADTTTTTRLLAGSVAAGSYIRSGGATYDSTGNVYLAGTDGTSGTDDADNLVIRKWVRSTNTFEAETSIDATSRVNPHASCLRPAAAPAVMMVVTGGTGATPTVEFQDHAINDAPTAATWNITDNQAHDAASSLALSWTFNDPDVGDTQGSYALRRQIGAAAYEYWNAGTSTWGASEVQNTSSTSSVTLASGWGADGDSNHKYAVKTWDAAGLEGTYSSELTVIPSAKDNPTISSPTDAGTVTAAMVTVEWSATTQTAYKARLLSSADSELESSGWVTSTATSHAFAKVLSNSTTYKVEVTTKNDEGLASTADTNTFSTSFTPPSTPTLVATGSAANGTITVAITNPGLGATESSNDVFARVATGGRADLDIPVGGDGLRIASGVAVDGSFTFYPASGKSYEFLVRALADNSASADSAWT